MTRGCGSGRCGDCPDCDIAWATPPCGHGDGRCSERYCDREPDPEEGAPERTPEEQAAWLLQWAELYAD